MWTWNRPQIWFYASKTTFSCKLKGFQNGVGSDSGVSGGIAGTVAAPGGSLDYLIIPQNAAAKPKTPAATVQALANNCGSQKPVAVFTAHCIENGLDASAVACVDAAAAVTQSLSPQIWHGVVNLVTKSANCWVLAP